MKTEFPIANSNKHVHLTTEHIAALFGEGYELTHVKDLSQPNQFASNEFVDIVGTKGTVAHVRVLGPARAQTQVEVLVTDTYKLGVPVVIRDSGKLAGTPGCKLVGPCGEVELSEGVIVAARHVHMSPTDAEEFGVKDGDIIDVEVEGPRALVFKNVLVRSGATHALEMHVDNEEGNAAGVKNGQLVKLIKKY